MNGLGYLQLRILQLLADADGGMMRAADLIAATRAKPGCVDSSLRRLHVRGLVWHPHHGHWAAT